MNNNRHGRGPFLFAALAALALTPLSTFAADRNPASTSDPAPVVMTITATAHKDAQPPALHKGDVSLYLAKEGVQVADMKRGDSLYLAVLIDDSLRSDIASQWPDLRRFLLAQPPTTYVAVAYARNGEALLAQDFTTNSVDGDVHAALGRDSAHSIA